MLVNEKVGFGHKGPGGWAKDEYLFGWPKPRFGEMVCCPGNVPGNFVGTDKHYKNIGQEEILKYLRRKLLPSH